MFEGSLVESTSLLRSRSRKPLYTSVAIQAAIATALVTIPLLHPEVIPTAAKHLTLFAPPVPPAPKPPPPRVVHMEASNAASAPSAPAATQTPRISNLFRRLTTIGVEDAPQLTAVNMGNSSPNAAPGWTSAPSAPNVSVAPSHAASSGPLHISTGVSAGLLLAPIQPIYPPIAKAAHVEGTVIVQAIISPTGHIESAHAVSGPLMLQPAALDAVRVARYRPFLLNGQPTAVDTTFTISFHLGS